jgi:hypothetical protein
MEQGIPVERYAGVIVPEKQARTEPSSSDLIEKKQKFCK